MRAKRLRRSVKDAAALHATITQFKANNCGLKYTAKMLGLPVSTVAWYFTDRCKANAQ